MSKQVDELTEAYAKVGANISEVLAEFTAALNAAFARVSQSESDTDTH